MRGATTCASKRAGAFSYFCFGPRFSDFCGAAAFLRLPKKSPRFGIGISSPCFVFCVLAIGLHFENLACQSGYGTLTDAEQFKCFRRFEKDVRMVYRISM